MQPLAFLYQPTSNSLSGFLNITSLFTVSRSAANDTSLSAFFIDNWASICYLDLDSLQVCHQCLYPPTFYILSEFLHMTLLYKGFRSTAIVISLSVHFIFIIWLLYTTSRYIVSRSAAYVIFICPLFIYYLGFYTLSRTTKFPGLQPRSILFARFLYIIWLL